MKVYVTNYNPNYEYDKAESFGEIVNMTQGYIPPHKYEKAFNTFHTYAQQANANDYLLLSGSNIICALALAAWLRYHEDVSILQHTKSKDENGSPIYYYVVHNVSTNSNEREASSSTSDVVL
jgi:hypothetical protein